MNHIYPGTFSTFTPCLVVIRSNQHNNIENELRREKSEGKE